MPTVLRGVCVWLTGRSGAGKSTVTAALVPMLEALGRSVSVYDVVPLLAKHWFEPTSEGKLLRKAYVAGEVARHGGIAICVTVSARADVRERARRIIGPERFVEVHFDVPPEVSAERKATRTKKPPMIKRLRRMVRRWRSLGRSTTGYQKPTDADLTVDTVSVPPEENAKAILGLLMAKGFVAGSDEPSG